MWIFGYGSLIWKPGFEYLERHLAYVHGWRRRFYQGSFDHRGVPGAPGRVVTLVPEAEEKCWGMLFKIDSEHAEQVVARLDHRESGGYERQWLRADFIANSAAQSTRALTYVAHENNPHFLGPACIETIANQIATAIGPSGANCDYVFKLAESLASLGVDDAHVMELAGLVKRLRAKE